MFDSSADYRTRVERSRTRSTYRYTTEDGEIPMRFMVLVKATTDSEAGVLPTSEQFAEMGKFNEQLVKDGVMLAGDGLQASSKGARMRFDGGRATVTDGPFAETKELLAGFWIVQGKSKEEIISRFMSAPFDRGEEIEIRQIFEVEDFGDNLPDEVREQEARRRSTVT